jgi:hypothetical protein
MSGHGDYSLLTEKQTELLEFLLSEQDIGNGFPSFVRMACHVGFFSDGSVERALNALRWAGSLPDQRARSGRHPARRRKPMTRSARLYGTGGKRRHALAGFAARRRAK